MQAQSRRSLGLDTQTLDESVSNTSSYTMQVPLPTRPARTPQLAPGRPA